MTKDELIGHLNDIKSEIEDSDNACEISVNFLYGIFNISIVTSGYDVYHDPDNYIRPIDKSTIKTYIQRVEYLFELDPDIEFISSEILDRSRRWSYRSWDKFKSCLEYIMSRGPKQMIRERVRDVLSIELFIKFQSVTEPIKKFEDFNEY